MLLVDETEIDKDSLEQRSTFWMVAMLTNKKLYSDRKMKALEDIINILKLPWSIAEFC